MIQNPPTPDETPGGKGEILSNDRNYRSDSKMIAQARRNHWNVPEATKDLVIERLTGIVETAENDRAVVSASRALIAADSLNVHRERIATPVQHEHSGTIDVEEKRVIILAAIDRELLARDSNGDIPDGNGSGG